MRFISSYSLYIHKKERPWPLKFAAKLSFGFFVINRVITNITAGNEDHAADETREHFRVKDHADTGNEAKYKTENWHDWE